MSAPHHFPGTKNMIAPLVPWPWEYLTGCDYCERRRLCQEVIAATSSAWRVVAICSDCRGKEGAA